MNKLLSCRCNMDTNRVEARFEDETVLAIDGIAMEDEYGNTPAQRAELDWLLYNKPLEYAQFVLGGKIEHYRSLGCDHGRLEDQAHLIKDLMSIDLWLFISWWASLLLCGKKRPKKNIESAF